MPSEMFKAEPCNLEKNVFARVISHHFSAGREKESVWYVVLC